MEGPAMPYRNRVDPFGEIHAVDHRGTLMGNRGNLHDPGGTIRRTFKRKAWVACALDFRGRKREIMAPGSYTELFFLDEATAFSAGHRPCGTCRKDALSAFRKCWREAKGLDSDAPVNLKDVDIILHNERLAESPRTARLETLPGGTMVRVGREHEAYLWWGNRLLKWNFAGYEHNPVIVPATTVDVITPWCLVELLAAGYPVGIHASADS
jgi:hypothetical protein